MQDQMHDVFNRLLATCDYILKWRCKYGYICDCDTWHMDLYTRVVEQRCVATVLFADMCV